MYHERRPHERNSKAEAIRRRREIVMREDDEEDMEPVKPAIQSKLEVSQPGDAQEQEADRIARKVVDGGDANISQLSAPNSIQSKSEGDTLHAPDGLQRQLDSSKGSGETLPEHVQQDIGGKMGADLSDVKIHRSTEASSMAESVNAKAFTHGQDIYFKNGNYDPGSRDGKELLAHEVVHTVQNGGGVGRKVMRKINAVEVDKELSNTIKSIRANAVAKLNSKNDPAAWDLLLYTAKLNEYFDTRAQAGMLISEMIDETPGFLDHIVKAANSASNVLSDIAAKSLVVNNKKSYLNQKNYKNSLLQKVDYLIQEKQSIANGVVSTSMMFHQVYADMEKPTDAWVPSNMPKIGMKEWGTTRPYDVAIDPHLEYLQKVKTELEDSKTDPQKMVDYGINLSLLVDNLGAARKVLDKMGFIADISGVWSLDEGQKGSFVQLYSIYYYHLVLKFANDMTGETPSKDKAQVNMMVGFTGDSWQQSYAQGVYTDLLHSIGELDKGIKDLIENQSKYKRALWSTGDKSLYPSEFDEFYMYHVDPMKVKVDRVVRYFNRAAKYYANKNYKTFWWWIENMVSPELAAIGELAGPFFTTAMVIQMHGAESELYSWNNPNRVKLEDVYFKLIEILRIRDLAERNKKYEEFVSTGELTELVNFYNTEFIPAYQKHQKEKAESINFWDILITIGAALVSGPVGIFVRTAVWGSRIYTASNVFLRVVMSWGAASIAEGTAFFIVEKSLRAIIMGDPLIDKNSGWDWLKTVGLFGALKGTGSAYEWAVARAAKKLPEALTTSALFTGTVKTIGVGVAYGTFEVWAAGIFRLEEQRWPTGEEFAEMSKQNALFLALLHVGMKAAEPISLSLNNAVITRQITNFNKQTAAYKARLEKFMKDPTPTPEKANEYLKEAENMLELRMKVYETYLKEKLITEANRNTMRSTIDAARDLLKTSRMIQKHNIRFSETNNHVGYYEGNSKPVVEYMKGLGYEVTNENKKTGTVVFNHPMLREMTMIRTNNVTASEIASTPSATVDRILGKGGWAKAFDAFWNDPAVKPYELLKHSGKSNELIKRMVEEKWMPGDKVEDSYINILKAEELQKKYSTKKDNLGDNEALVLVEEMNNPGVTDVIVGESQLKAQLFNIPSGAKGEKMCEYALKQTDGTYVFVEVKSQNQPDITSAIQKFRAIDKHAKSTIGSDKVGEYKVYIPEDFKKFDDPTKEIRDGYLYDNVEMKFVEVGGHKIKIEMRKYIEKGKA